MQLRVKELREGKGWNQTVLGYHAGLSPSQISLIENGKRNPTVETLEGIATALGVEVGDLFPKATASPSPLQVEDTEERRRFSPETWPHLRAMLTSWSGTVESVTQFYRPPIQDLPNQPTGVEFTRTTLWLRPLLRTIDTINKALMNSGVAATTNELLAAFKDGEPIPADLEQKVRRFHQAIDTLNTEVEPKAREWLGRYSETERINEINELAPRWESEERQAINQHYKQGLREVAPEEWLAWGQELDQWAGLIDVVINAEYAPRVERLPERPSVEQIYAELPWIERFLEKIRCVEGLLDGLGVENGIVLSFQIYTHQGHPIPEEAQSSFERYLTTSRAVLFGARGLRQRVVSWANLKEEVQEFRDGADSYDWAEVKPLAHRRFTEANIAKVRKLTEEMKRQSNTWKQ